MRILIALILSIAGTAVLFVGAAMFDGMCHCMTAMLGTSDLKNVYVVSMELAWSQYCGNKCAMSFQATRNIALDEEGKVLAVENDTCAPGIVSQLRLFVVLFFW